MPFQSKAQNAWGHTPAGVKALGGPSKVKEWEGATDYKHLPQKVSSHADGGSPRPIAPAPGVGPGNAKPAQGTLQPVSPAQKPFNPRDYLPGGVQSNAKGGAVMNKGFMQKHQSFAQGGEVLGKTSKWLKSQDRFSENEGPLERNKTQDNFEKGATTPSITGAPPSRGKVLPTVKPRQ
jgi:hypothetical protein